MVQLLDKNNFVISGLSREESPFAASSKEIVHHTTSHQQNRNFGLPMMTESKLNVINQAPEKLIYAGKLQLNVPHVESHGFKADKQR